MKSYHLTQEQALEIAKLKGVEQMFSDDVYLATASEITALVNAVLDQVLGEPVAYRWYESKWEEYRYSAEPNKHRACEALYAPKEQS